MRKLNVFNFMSLNGYFKGANNDISWHKRGTEEMQYAAEMLKSGASLLFGRETYEILADYWLSDEAKQKFPEVAEGMRQAEKIVFSSTLKELKWGNTKIMNNNIAKKIHEMKQLPGKDITILGSGTICCQLAELGLIDEYFIMVDPVILAEGTSIFHDVNRRLNLTLIGTQAYKSGVVLLRYQEESL